jgi:hypothetical protein
MKKMKEIYSAFVKAQKAFAPALKSSLNPHFKSKYVGLDGCIEAVIDALNNNGIGLIQQTHETENGVMVETVLIHESGEQMSGGKLFVPATKQDAQGFGSALTYARRYSLMATCGIAPEDDDGNAASNSYQNRSQPAPVKKSFENSLGHVPQQTLSEQQVIAQIRAVKTEAELVDVWKNIPASLKLPAVVEAKDQMKSLFTGE